MRELLTAISQYKRKNHEYPKVQMSEFFYHTNGSSLDYLEIEVTDEVDRWELPEAVPGIDYCCGARSSGAGCCPW